MIPLAALTGPAFWAAFLCNIDEVRMKFLSVFCMCLFLTASLAAQSNPVPFIDTHLVPTSIAPGASAFTLSLNGGNFVSTSVVQWNGSARTTHFLSKARLTASILASDIAKSSTASVTVKSPGAPASNVAFFSVVNPVASVAFTGSTFPTLGDPESVVTADFNNDGILDLAVGNAGNLAILLGNGDGTFQPVARYQANYEPQIIASGDFNGDGAIDLAVVSSYDSFVSVLLGNGAGRFHAPASYPVGSNPLQVVTGDFNRDGKLDMVVLAYPPSILLGNGDGTFQPQTTLPGGGSAICTGDFNGDGVLDLAITTDISVLIYPGNGDGTFQPYREYPMGSNLEFSVATSDLNGDGVLDLVAGTYYGIVVLLGNGDGSFGPPVEYSTTSSVFNAPGIADLNGDGKPDLVVANADYNTAAILMGNGDGTFQTPVYFSGGFSPLNLSFGDFNNDGAMDLALAAFGGGGNTGGAFVSLQTNGPAVLLSSFKLAFPLQVFDTRSKPEKIQLSNIGKQPLTINQINIQGADPHDFLQKNNCGTSLAVGSTCAIVVVFDPTFKGTRIASLVITDDALQPTQSVDLAGTATWVTLSSGALDFGDQMVGTVSPPQTVTVTNVGTGTVKVSSVAITGYIGWQTSEYHETNNCGTLAPGAVCTITVTFAPTLKGGASADLWVHHNGGVKAQAVSLAGHGT
jgi:FG-GAP-like repeat